MEKKINNNWKPLPYINGEPIWTKIGHILKGDSSNEEEINWEWLYGELTPGNYRITKGILYVRSSGDYDKIDVSTEFTIDIGIRGY